MSSPAQTKPVSGLSVRTMRESDLPAASSINRIAFATFVGAPNPETFSADREYVATRWRADPAAALVAELNGEVVGSNFATNWGSFAFFGPLTIRPELWNQRIAQHLLASTMDLLDAWGVRDAGLFTFAHSPKHVNLYQKFGFWPRFLTAIMSKPVRAREPVSCSTYSGLKETERQNIVHACRELTDSIYEGLDVTREILCLHHQDLGETVLTWRGDTLDALAVCHCGEGTEAGANTCYIKFAAVRPGANTEERFEHLLGACEALASERGLQRIEAGVNMNRSQAYRAMLRCGFRTEIQGVAMHKPDAPGYNRPNIFVLDDWR